MEKINPYSLKAALKCIQMLTLIKLKVLLYNIARYRKRSVITKRNSFQDKNVGKISIVHSVVTASFWPCDSLS